MNVREGMQGMWRWTRGIFSRPTAGDDGDLYDYGAEDAYRYGYGPAGTLWRGLSGRSMEIAEVQEEVAAEMRGQVLVAGLDDAAVRGLLARLRGRPPVPPAGPLYREGFFTLATLPAEPGIAWAGDGGEPSLSPAEVLALVSEADVVLYVYAAGRGWQEADDRWYARLRVAGRPVIVVLGDDLPPDLLPEREGERDGGPPGERPVRVRLAPGASGDEAPADVLALVARILERCGRLAIPLAQEIPACRAMIARRITRHAALSAALLGAEPIPLLDLPLQVAVNWRMALQLAAIYGRGPLDYRSREMIGTVAWNLGLRRLIQQVLKLVPVLGWAVSAVLSGSATWLLGNGLQRYFQDEERWHEAPGALKMALAERRRRTVGRIRGWWGRLARRAGRE